MPLTRRQLLGRWLKKPPKWSIGIYAGPSPVDLRSPSSIVNPVFTAEQVKDVAATFVADPFMLKRDSIWYLFFEVLNSHTNQGLIAFAKSEDTRSWVYGGVVLREPFHLSYPCIFEAGGDFYLVPESHQATSVRLYKALDFPTRWVFVKTLLDGEHYIDPSVFRYGEYWWMFTGNLKNDTLSLHYSSRLEGPWIEHPANPIVRGDPHIARPGGRVLADGHRIIRYAQDDYPRYGHQVWAFQIADLSTTRYEERRIGERPVVKASGAGWNQDSMHHVDAHQIGENNWIACVDGEGKY